MSNANIQQPPTLEMIKAKHKATWEDGNYANFAKYMEPGAVEVLEGWNIKQHEMLLDVGCGAGQTAIPAAKMGIHVTGIDIAENLLKHARQRASDDQLDVNFDLGDAEDLPYANNSYDAIISMFGAMFAPRPDQVVEEFARVLRPGGKLMMANWTPTSMPAQIFKTVSSIIPPPIGSTPPVLWGEEETVKQRLSNYFIDIKLTRRIYPQWRYTFNVDELVNLFRQYFGPVKRAFDALESQQHKLLHDSLKNIYLSNSIMKNNVLIITGGEFLEVIATRR